MRITVFICLLAVFGCSKDEAYRADSASEGPYATVLCLDDGLKYAVEKYGQYDNMIKVSEDYVHANWFRESDVISGEYAIVIAEIKDGKVEKLIVSYQLLNKGMGIMNRLLAQEGLPETAYVPGFSFRSKDGCKVFSVNESQSGSYYEVKFD